MEPILRSRLLPQFSFRAMMALTVVAALLAVTARAAGSGAPFAKAIMVVVLFVAAVFVLAIVAFLISWSIALLVVGRVDDTRAGSPFSEDQLPPQHLKPREPLS